jgi:hypothetical protein
MVQGRSLSAIGSEGLAWPRAAALEILRRLRGKGIAVLGGDVVQVEDQRLRRTSDNWHSEPAHAEPFTAYAERSVAESEAFILDYREAGPGFCYVLVLADRLR